MNNERLLWVDIAKGIGIILVILGHMIDGYSFAGRYIWSFHMPLFFFLSGLFMSETISIQLLLKRARQLLLPCCIFTIISCIVFHYAIEKSLDFLSVSLPVPLWFLPILFLAEIECRFFICKINVYLLLVFNLSVALLCQHYNIGTVYSISSVFISSVFYLMGYLFQKYNMMREISVFVFMAILSIVPTMVYIFNVHTNIGNNTFTIVGIIVAILGIAQVIILSKRLTMYKITSSVLSFMGRNSLVLMLTHMIFLQLYCHYIIISNQLLYKVIQLLFVFCMSIGSIFLFKGRLALLIGIKNKSICL